MSNPTILVVEDHDIVRRALRDWLSISFRDYDVVEAKSGEEAVEMARTTLPRLALIDIGLPQMSGIEATRQLKRITPQLPVIILSIHESPTHMADAAQAGASAYVPKRKLHSDLYPVMAQLLGNGK